MADDINLEAAAEGIDILKQLGEAAKAATENLAVLGESSAALNETLSAGSETVAAETEALVQKNAVLAELAAGEQAYLDIIATSAESRLAIAEQDKAALEEQLSGAATFVEEQLANYATLDEASIASAQQQIENLKNLGKEGKDFVKQKGQQLKEVLAGEKGFTTENAKELASRLTDAKNFDLSKLASGENLQKGLDFLQSQADSKYKAVRVAAKAAALAQVGIDTGKAAIAAYTSLVGIPIIGPGLAVGAAAAAIAVGAQQASKIASQEVAEGGLITGPGTDTSDSIPAFLSNGEFVVRSQAVRNIGIDRLSYMNQNGRMPYFQDGGLVGDTSGTVSSVPPINITVNALDSADVADFARTKLFPIIEQGIQERTLNV